MISAISTLSLVGEDCLGGVDERCVGGVDEGVGRRVCEKISTILFRSETLDKDIF